MDTYVDCLKRGKYDPFNEILSSPKKLLNAYVVRTDGYIIFRSKSEDILDIELEAIQKKKSVLEANINNSNNKNFKFRIRH